MTSTKETKQSSQAKRKATTSKPTKLGKDSPKKAARTSTATANTQAPHATQSEKTAKGSSMKAGESTKPKKPSNAERAKQVVEKLELIKSAQRRVDKCDGLLANCRKNATDAKADYDSATKALRECVLDNNLTLPLSGDAIKPDTGKTPAKQSGVDKDNRDPKDSSIGKWRSKQLFEIKDIPRNAITLLRDANITKLGQMADFTATGKPLALIKGVGKVAAEKIRDAIEKFYANDPVFKQFITASGEL